ncbi:Glycosyl phosphatidyl inositol anchor synthesis, variant 2 [Entomophthora muscae]|uniref:Glycosyl phosphatidyl inositol anchor synthesis, variant 2 n=2 Tax=Entomophthora muscae TaxID=34485 RepID=A0ACC2S5P2_9FUNG|nr:Glycosyl phosphatidyl inositol anchor synthesis, variant 2 [Entomophthora muscae]
MQPYKLDLSSLPLDGSKTSYGDFDFKPPAKRLVLIVGDGMRADALFSQDGVKTAPHIHQLIRTRASFGVSHTRVPTESRPGHVAIIGGFYEDVSAITKGWKLNPINFDSLFNQSSITFSFGSPDILPMFQLGASDTARVNTSMYTSEDENFAKDPAWLDTWVFEHVDLMLDQAAKDPELDAKLRGDGVVIFLHLLGMDTAGHASRPGSEACRNVLANLDKSLARFEERLEAFYNDSRTSYLLTSDHGMGNQGSHGDGHPDNTRTPLVAWGAGIQPATKSPMKGHDSFTANWDVAQYWRKDVMQADIAPLMASLIGVNYPMNSVGILPLDYLTATDAFKATSALVNARQICAQYNVKLELKMRHEIFFKPFLPLSSPTTQPESQLQHISTLILEGKYTEAERLSVELINVTIEGLRYLQTYDWLFLRSIVSSGYAGWILYCIAFLLKANPTLASRRPSSMPRTFIHCLGIFLGGVMAVQRSPLWYYLYLAFPIFFWDRFFLHGHSVVIAIKDSWRRGSFNQGMVSMVLALVALELLVVSYFKREILGLGLGAWALWPWMTVSSHAKQRHSTLLLQWTLACLAASVFPFLPVEKEESRGLLFLGGVVILMIGGAAYQSAPKLTLNALQKPGQDNVVQAKDIRRSLSIQMSLVALSIFQMWVSSGYLQSHQLVPSIVHLAGWFSIVASIAYLVASTRSSNHYIYRLLTIFLGFSPSYIILSISYEVLFYVVFFAILILWLSLEQVIYESSNLPSFVKKVGLDAYRPISLGDLRPAVMFLFFINLAFFGTGNIASISSFSLQAVFRLTVEFDAFLMGALLVYKILTPFFLLASHYALAGSALCLQPLAPFLLVLSISDVMTLNFFYLVRDEGSWLDIGTSISHFAIVSLFSLFVSLLYLWSYWLTRRAILRPSKALLRQD